MVSLRCLLNAFSQSFSCHAFWVGRPTDSVPRINGSVCTKPNRVVYRDVRNLAVRAFSLLNFGPLVFRASDIGNMTKENQYLNGELTKVNADRDTKAQVRLGGI